MTHVSTLAAERGSARRVAADARYDSLRVHLTFSEAEAPDLIIVENLIGLIIV